MSARPLVSVYSCEDAKVVGQCPMPDVCLAPIRPDHIRFVITQLAKNARQAYAVSTYSGYGSSAVSWGTGRAVARIPRVSGGGTHRAGQGAFGNMCRGGGMYAPTRTWRRWHRKVNRTEKRHALASAIAASSIPALVMARGHRIDALPEVPMVLSNDMEHVQKTKNAMAILKKIGVAEDLERVVKSKVIRAGKGKARNRKYRMRLGPLIVHNSEKEKVCGYRNIPGVDLCHVDRLNVLKLAPGGSLGRLVIYSESAFRRLNELYDGSLKKGYSLPRPLMSNTDLARIINSTEIQAVLKPKKDPKKPSPKKLNLLTNKRARKRVDPTYVKKTTVKKTTA
eukprot:Blabericola_migrator_1__4553@NODE_2422_length_2784_cov_360_047479_g1517_i0_p1_GENE_NODE_2422_length_2784_cov_360_047479_g1517_i0NODE_2422_length_2784_cov_360_047479_g1517_i0_p1_ORF_typecomplete_len338_score37_61Ribosomal_L4/PF00573_22/5_9e38Ribos_L4_asso_C/PF14374_6/1e02Ribos_L4_asso_C/PF14374_6/2_6e17NicO/PF03824_16/0_0076_NODE_2422_length_2784_cov_360_047479_g1517_i017182731